MKYLNKRSIGLDISDNTIEVVELGMAGSTIKLISCGRTFLKKGVVRRGHIIDKIGLARTLKKLFAEARPNAIHPENIIFGFPESQVYTHIFKINSSDVFEIENKVKDEVGSVIPLSKNDLLYNYRIVGSKNIKSQGKRVLIMASSNRIVSRWQLFFKENNLPVKQFDIEALALYRGLFNKRLKETIGILDIGAETSSLSVFSASGLEFSFELQYGGNYFTKMIAEKQGLDQEAAQELKKQGGLNSRIVEEALREPINKIIKSITENINYYNNGRKEVGAIDPSYQKVGDIYLLGGSSKLHGIVNYFSSRIKNNIYRGRSFIKDSGESIEYVEAVGLAVRGLDRKWSDTDPVFQIDKTGDKYYFLTDYGKQILNKIKKFKFGKIFKSKYFIIGLLSLFMIIVWATISTISRESEKPESFQEKLPSQILNIQLPLTVSEENYEEGKIRGRILKEVISRPSPYEEATAFGKNQAILKINNSEELWPINLKKNKDTDSVIFPLELEFLVYNKSDVGRLLLQAAKSQLDIKELAVEEIKLLDIRPTANPDIYLVHTRAEFSVLNDFQEKTQEIEDPSKSFKTFIIEIKDIGSRLNVRNGSGINFDKISSVSSGERFLVIDESVGWYKIMLPNKDEGWVFAEFTKIIE